MMHLPRDLSRWDEELAIFPRDVALGLGGLAQRLAIAIGPMRTRAVRGTGEPDGFEGLARRGDYERLLMTEWLLAEEAPDEFLRRMVMGEHAFLRWARREPSSSRRCVVLFDGGAEQLGAPRIAQIAALVVFARRAADARADMAWGRLRGPLHHGVTKEGVQALLEMRAVKAATPDDVRAAAKRHLGSALDELWIVGGARLRDAAAEARASSVQIEEVVDPALRQVRVVVRPARGPERACVLDLPPHDACARLLRDPFQLAVAAPARSDVAFAPEGGVVLVADGRRLLGRGDDGSFLSMTLPSSARAPKPRLARWTPRRDHRVLAAGWARAPKRAFVVTEHEGTLHAHVLSRRGDRVNATEAHGALPREPGDDARPLGAAHRSSAGGIYFVDSARRLVLLRSGKPPEAIAGDVVAFASGRAAFLIARAVEGADRHDLRGIALSTYDGKWSSIAFAEAELPSEVFIGAVEPTPLVAVRMRAGEWTIFRGNETQRVHVPPDLEVRGVLEKGWSPPTAGLVCVDSTRTRLVLLRPDALEPLCDAPGGIAHVTASASSRDIAYLGPAGELTVYSLASSGVVARVRREAVR